MFEIVNGVLKSLTDDEIKNNVLTIPEGVKEIALSINWDENRNFFKIHKIVFPSSLKKIKSNSFSFLSKLREVKLNEGLEYIGEYAFSNTELKEIVIPSSVKEIKKAAFSSCNNLKKAVFPKDFKKIESYLFKGCRNLEDLVLPENLQEIETEAFIGCSLYKLNKLPESLTTLGGHVFDRTDISDIQLPSNLNSFESSVFANSEVDKIELDKAQIRKDKRAIIIKNKSDNPFMVFEDDEKYYIVYKQKIINKMFDKGYKEVNAFNPNSTHTYFDYSTFLIGDTDKLYNKFKNVTKNYAINPSLLLQIQKDLENGEEIDTQFYNNLSKLEIPYILKDDADKLAYNLGIFKKPIQETKISKSGKEYIETVNYAHKAYEFFRNINYYTARNYFEGIEYLQFKPGFSKFITDKNNIPKILEQEDLTSGFIGKCFNKFEEVQETNKSHKGSQRQLAPTVEKFINFFAENKFNNVNDEYKNFAKFLGKYYEEQEVFDAGKDILEYQQRYNIKSNITNKSIIEEKLDNIERLKKSIESNAGKTLSNLGNINESAFTYEFLDKHDWLNLVLGKYCDCCAHLKGFGGGIAIASMLNPDVQNLVIKNSVGKIISKATLYVNRAQGYGVFNTIEVKQNVSSLSLIYVYKKYMEAINKFVEVYNEENKYVPIKQINVGMNNNDLSDEIIKNNKKSDVILKAIDYSKYSMLCNFYSGDWAEQQFVLYKDEEQSNKEDLNV